MQHQHGRIDVRKLAATSFASTKPDADRSELINKNDEDLRSQQIEMEPGGKRVWSTYFSPNPLIFQAAGRKKMCKNLWHTGHSAPTPTLEEEEEEGQHEQHLKAIIPEPLRPSEKRRELSLLFLLLLCLSAELQLLPATAGQVTYGWPPNAQEARTHTHTHTDGNQPRLAAATNAPARSN